MTGFPFYVRCRLALIAAVGVLAGVLGPERAYGLDATVVSGTDYRSALERETFLLVNHYRTANGLAPLVWNDAIAEEARGHSRDMATHEVGFGHGRLQRGGSTG